MMYSWCVCMEKSFQCLFTKWGERGSVKSWGRVPDPNCECDSKDKALKRTKTQIYPQTKGEKPTS